MKLPRRRIRPLAPPTREERSQRLKDRLYAAASAYLEHDPFDSDELTDQEHALATLAEQIKDLILNMPTR